jgi:hypothetical protein
MELLENPVQLVQYFLYNDLVRILLGHEFSMAAFNILMKYFMVKESKK